MILTLFVFPFILSGLTIFFKNIKSASKQIETNVKDPIKGIKSIPSQLSKVTGQVKNIVKKTATGVKSLTKK